ncbi:MAG: DUF1592 domain-containing protein [Planctomycetota bacterium]|nr:MAG: DUF1592 domain-containing protein [Planctomycetota bacterium]
MFVPSSIPFHRLRRFPKDGVRQTIRMLVLPFASIMAITWSVPPTAAQQESEADSHLVLNLLQDYCADCHWGPDAEAGIDAGQLAQQTFAEGYSSWQRIASVLELQTMPPKDAEQPLPEQRRRALEALRRWWQTESIRAADDPGPIGLRRVSAAEFQYCVEDLTGQPFALMHELMEDSVGGSGFTNASTGQFMQPAVLERFLKVAHQVAAHAMVGCGPVYFAPDPGSTGMELSAIERIQSIYRRHGFRAAAGEGAEPFGMHRYPLALAIAWQYRHRAALQTPRATIERLATDHGLEPGFARHVWNVLQLGDRASFPLDRIIAAWQALPAPVELPNATEDPVAVILPHAEKLYAQIEGWQARLAGAASDEEEAPLLTDGSIQIPAEVHFEARAVRRRVRQDGNFSPDLNDLQIYAGDTRIRFRLMVEPASDGAERARVICSDLQFRPRFPDGVKGDLQPLRGWLDDADSTSIDWGENPGGEPIAEDSLALPSGRIIDLVVRLPSDATSGELHLDARPDALTSRDCVVRFTIADATEAEGDGIDPGMKSYSSLLRDPHSEAMDRWEAGIAQFARLLPQISHREPTPSDRDPIPLLYDNTYNMPERNYFHTAIKYHRDDAFLVEHMLTPEERQQLDRAWADLLLSFDYHELNIRFACRKFDCAPPSGSIEQWQETSFQGLPDPVRSIAREYFDQWVSMQRLAASAQPQHVRWLAEFASRCWRRPLLPAEIQRIESEYRELRRRGVQHAEAVRGGIARILVSPHCLYRVEPMPGTQPVAHDSKPDMVLLSDYELASRLSFLIWSSLPDDQLLDAARRSTLRNPDELQRQVRRMMQSPNSKRMAREFFGQWLGFYRFDRFRGIDSERFPEFDDALRSMMYEEAQRFFHYLLQEDRPFHEIFLADYTFLNEPLARHYQIRASDADLSHRLPQQASDRRYESTGDTWSQVTVAADQRGGILGMGAILAATSAPLRTSPVKRGDWVLRRLLGTPVPPPPADAGSLPADEPVSRDLTIREQLEMHRHRADCVNCHLRIDPLGFPLEVYDPIGRTRTTYLSGQPVEAVGRTADGKQIDGVVGLKTYLAERHAEMRRMLARQLVAYALGRPETIYDHRLIARIADGLQRDPRISTAIITLVESPQFNQRQRTSAVAETGNTTVEE